MQLALMSLIIISGVIFMHKEVKSTGEIVMHNHPYDFTSDQPRPQETDDQIDFLNIVYHQHTVQNALIFFEEPICSSITIAYYHTFHPLFESRSVDHAFLRGPPAIA